MDHINCATLNVRGLRKKSKRESLFAYLNSKNINIACLQETYCTQDFSEMFNRNWDGDVFHSFASSSHCKGVCILINLKCEYKVLNIHKDDDGRKLLLNIMIDDKMYTIISVYCPNNVNERTAFLKHLNVWTKQHCQSVDNIICGGDFNCTINIIDRKTKGYVDTSSNCLKKYLSNFNLCDVWRRLNPDTSAFTYVDPSRRGYDSRIDYLFYSHNLSCNVINCSIIPAPVPDHNAVECKLRLKESKRGPGIWKMNTSVLGENDYVTAIKDIIKQTIIDYNEVGY